MEKFIDWMIGLFITILVLSFSFLVILGIYSYFFDKGKAKCDRKEPKTEQLNAIKIKGDTLYILQEGRYQVETYIKQNGTK